MKRLALATAALFLSNSALAVDVLIIEASGYISDVEAKLLATGQFTTIDVWNAGAGIPDVQSDRLAAAQRLAGELNAHVVLKGNGSVLVARDGHWFINTTGNPGMASAGMGDVLSGILGSLLAQGLSGEAALVLEL